MEDGSRKFSRNGLWEAAGPAEQDTSHKRIQLGVLLAGNWDFVVRVALFACHPLCVLRRYVVKDAEEFAQQV